MMKLHKAVLWVLLVGAFSLLSPLHAQPGYPHDPYDDDRGYAQDPHDDRGYTDDPYGYGSPQVEVGFFYQELSPYGDWIYTHEYGWAWMPRNVPIGWRPYTYGRWVPSQVGWCWVSFEPFGWATYHYGRWALHPRYGWVWTPGRTWGPAWVSWQSGDGYVGWAPLPPEVGFELGVGLRLGGLDLSLLLRPNAYTFVEDRLFLEPRLERHAVPISRNVTIIPRTRNVTRYSTRNNVVINGGVELDRIERAVGRRVRPWRIDQTQTYKSARVRDNAVTLYQPPRQRLETVKVDDRQPRRRRAEPPKHGKTPPRVDRSSERPVAVAPRVRHVEPSERVEQRRQEDAKRLAAFEHAERQRLERAQRLEREKRAHRADAAAVARRQRAEKQALEEQLRRTRQHLEAKREVQRKAERVTPPDRKHGDDKKADRKGHKKPPKSPSHKPPRR